jgi:Protein of unknown function (DUF1499)
LRRGWRVVLVCVAVVLLGIALAALGLRIYLGREAETRLATDEVIDFAARNATGRANVFAMCPAGFCNPPGDLASPVFRIGWERLHDYWRELIAAQRRVEQVGWNEKRRRATYIQRSAMLHFPDIVTVEFVSLGPDRASLAIDSRSRYGKGDMGVNRRRVTEWMDVLQHMMREDERPGS